MSCRIRHYQVGVVYAVSIRTNDRQFLFRPNHNPRNPLLDASCPAYALDPRNDIEPLPSVLNIIGSSVARAQRKHPIRIHWVICHVDHLHMGFSIDSAAMRENVAPFFRTLHSLVARQINKLWGRENHVFGERFHAEPCLDDASTERQLIYAVTNTVKDGLVARVADAPFFSTATMSDDEKTRGYWFIDHRAWWNAGPRRKNNRKKDHVRWAQVEISPVPSQVAMTKHQRRTWLRRRVREEERRAAEERAAEGRSTIGFEKLSRLEPRDRPRNPKKSAGQPLCHSEDAVRRKQFAREWREFLTEYRGASIDYRNGDHEREFPEGSYRPPLITPYSKSRL